MANLITHSLTFTKESLTEYFLKPLFVENDIQNIITFRTDIKSSEKLDLISTLSKITKAYAQGASFTPSTGVTITQKTITVANLKAEVTQNGHQFLNYVKQAMLKNGYSENDISGTIFEEIILSIFIRAIKRDMERIIFFGDTAAETLSSYVKTGTADTTMNVADGFWKTIIAAFAATTIPAAQRVTMSNGAVAQVGSITLTGTAGTANITVMGKTYLATFNSSLTQTAADFVTTHATALALRHVTVTSTTAKIIFTSSIAGVSFGTPTIANVTSNLNGGAYSATTANTAPAALTTDEAYSAFQSLISAATDEMMQERDMLQITCTRSMLENYLATMRKIGGAETSYQITLNGLSVPTFDGIPIIVRPEWDAAITDNFYGAYPHRALLTRKDNLIVGTDAAEDAMNIELFYDPISQNNYFRVEYKLGMQYVHEAFIAAAY